MILIDKLSYHSKLRYVNASEKLMYAVLTLVLCILSRSVRVAVLVFVVNGMLTVGKGGIRLFHYIKLLMIPIVFLIVGTGAIIVNVSETPLDAFAFSVGNGISQEAGRECSREPACAQLRSPRYPACIFCHLIL